MAALARQPCRPHRRRGGHRHRRRRTPDGGLRTRRATAIGRATSSLDARLEYDRAKREADRLEGLIAAALARGQGVASMRGALQSAEAARVVNEVLAIDAEVFAIDASKFGSQTFEQFADSLATIRQLQTRITAVAEKCRASITASEHERDHAVEDQRLEHAARLNTFSGGWGFATRGAPLRLRMMRANAAELLRAHPRAVAVLLAANRWRIPDWLELEVRQRDRECVYCRVPLLDSAPADGTREAVATWEHIVNDARIVTRENIARCCASCNASKGTKALAVWIESAYCRRRGISAETVAEVVRRALTP